VTKKVYGRTRDGSPIDEAMIEGFVEEAERGYADVDFSKNPRGRGRPPLGDAAKTVESVRLDRGLREAVQRRAQADGVTASDVIRDALNRYLERT
jgi:hypothetical protein